MKLITTIVALALALFISCTNKNLSPRLPYSDISLLDSACNTNYKYYNNKPDTFLSGIHGPHGSFKLRFNSIAYTALTDNGKLPLGAKFPDGAFIVKDIYKNNELAIYAFMYKRNNKWIWGEAYKNGEFIAKAADGDKSCVGCHSQSGNRDLAVTFNFY